MERPCKCSYFRQLSPQPLILPISLTPARAGFPSQADDYLEGKLDLNELIIQHPAATYIFRVEGNSMESERIYNDDLLVIDAAIKPNSGDVVIAILDGGFVVKRMIKRNNHILLMAMDGDYEPIVVKEGRDFEVWGKVTFSIHKY